MTKTQDASQVRELQDSELGQVSGGLVVPSIIGILIGPLDPGPISVKEPAPAKHWFNGG
jgi:hypothetical protein